ncbi:hypothetical protein [Bacillus sp. FSL R9-9410]|uniref:hypothetical protein n=1 Tax=Bacillus sp. FSL R9-9410 TaxID=2921590 RepID=UPI00310187D0
MVEIKKDAKKVNEELGEEVTEVQEPMLTNEEAKAMFAPKRRPGMVYARWSDQPVTDPKVKKKATVIQGMVSARHLNAN